MKYLLSLFSLLNLASAVFVVLVGLQVIALSTVSPAIFFLAVILCAWCAFFNSIGDLVKFLRS